MSHSWPKHLERTHSSVVLDRIAQMHLAMDECENFVKARGVLGVRGFAFETLCVVEDGEDGRAFTNFIVCDQKTYPSFAFEFSCHKAQLIEFVKTEFNLDSGRFYSRGFEKVEHAVVIEDLTDGQNMSVYFNSHAMATVVDLLKAIIEEYNANGRI